MKFKLGDKVRCIESNARKGYGWKECLEFTIDKIIPADDCTHAVYFPGNNGHGVYEGALELVEEKIDFTKKGTKLPEFPAGIPERCVFWMKGRINSTLSSPFDDFISYGRRYCGGIEYIPSKSPNFKAAGGTNYFTFPFSEIERLAKEQGMIKETVKTKELPKSFGIKQAQTNPLWNKFIAWINTTYEKKWSGDCYNYYGITKKGIVDGNFTDYHYDQIITLEEWNEIVNGKQEKQNKMEITRTQLKCIHDVACSTWQKKIETEYATRNPWGDTIEFTQKEIDEMFGAATPSQKEVLEVIFGKQTKEIDLSKGKVDGLELFKPGPTHIDETLIMVRTGQNLANKAFLLNGNYNWEIVTDEVGCKCLVPTRK